MFTLDMWTNYNTEIRSKDNPINNLHKNYIVTVNVYYTDCALRRFRVLNDDKHLFNITQANQLLKTKGQILFSIKNMQLAQCRFKFFHDKQFGIKKYFTHRVYSNSNNIVHSECVTQTADSQNWTGFFS